MKVGARPILAQPENRKLDFRLLETLDKQATIQKTKLSHLAFLLTLSFSFQKCQWFFITWPTSHTLRTLIYM